MVVPGQLEERASPKTAAQWPSAQTVVQGSGSQDANQGLAQHTLLTADLPRGLAKQSLPERQEERPVDQVLEGVLPPGSRTSQQDKWESLIRMYSPNAFAESQPTSSPEKKDIFVQIAEHKAFENLTLCVITVNAFWIGVDLELNRATSWSETHWVFKVADNLFCGYFALEVLIRVCAHRPMVCCFTDRALMFDNVLVILMALETWVLPLISAFSKKGAISTKMTQATVLRLLRLLRLSRMVRLMRALPELMVLVKGMITAIRSVATNFIFLLAGLWVFGIVFLQQYADVDSNDSASAIALRMDFFSSLGATMVTLFVNGTMLDDLNALAILLKDDSMWMLGVFFFFVLLSSLTLLNMLIGVLAEVVANTAEQETSEQAVLEVIKTMQSVFNVVDLDCDDQISALEFARLVRDKNSPAVKSLIGIGINPCHLESLFEELFDDGAEADLLADSPSSTKSASTKQLGFVEFMYAILKLKPSTVSVQDVWSLRQNSLAGSLEVMEALNGMKARLEHLADAACDLQDRLPAALAVPADRTVGVPAADPTQWTEDQDAPTQAHRNVRGSLADSTSPAVESRAELQSMLLHCAEPGTTAAEEMALAKSPRQTTECLQAPIAAHSVRWPPSPVEPLAPLPSLGGPGSSSSASLPGLVLSSPRRHSRQKSQSEGKLSMVPTEMIIEEMARRMLKRFEIERPVIDVS